MVFNWGVKSKLKAFQSRMGYEPDVNPLHIASNHKHDLTHIIRVAMDEISKAYEGLGDGQKLLILHGEDHRFISHQAVKSGLAISLNSAGYNPLVALEHDYMMFGEAAQQHPSMLFWNSQLQNEYTPYSNSYFHFNLWAHDIATAFVDASVVDSIDYLSDSREKKDAFNLFDPETSDVINLLGYEGCAQDLSSYDAKGIHVRNAFMLRRAFDKANLGGHDVIFMAQGAVHLWGRFNEFRPFEQSTGGLVLNAGVFQSLVSEPAPKVITIMPYLSKSFAQFSSSLAAQHVSKALVYSGLTSDQFERSHLFPFSLEALVERWTLQDFWRRSIGKNGDPVLPMPERYLKMKNQICTSP